MAVPFTALIERRPWTALAALAALSTAGYLALFGLVLDHKNDGVQYDYLVEKALIAGKMGPGKLLVAAGSNARFSHSCATLQQALGRPCANLGLSFGIGEDIMLHWAAEQIEEGDLLYLPLEYPSWRRKDAFLHNDAGGRVLFRRDRERLAALGWRRFAGAAFSYDTRHLAGILAEAVFIALGSDNNAISSLNAQGDETVNTPKAARAYAAAIARLRQAPTLPVTDNSLAEKALPAVVARARAKGAVVVCGLPTIFNDRPVDAKVVASIREACEWAGARFVALENRSQYPRADFYDSAYHLHSEAAAVHSRLLAEALRPFLPPLPAGERVGVRGGSLPKTAGVDPPLP